MRTQQVTIRDIERLTELRELSNAPWDLGVVFASPSLLKEPKVVEALNSLSLPIVGCTSSGEISSEGVTNDSLVLTALRFERGTRTQIKVCELDPVAADDAERAGAHLGRELAAPDLKLVFVIAPGVNLNGSALIRGLAGAVAPEVRITGGLAGDYGKFKETHTIAARQVATNHAIGVGFYGDHVHVSFGSEGGWKPFGPLRRVTRAEGNLLFELDGQSAIGIYERYLGDKAKQLPGSALLYPFGIVEGDQQDSNLIRTILGLDRERGCMIFAGDIPNGGTIRLMHTGTDGLVNGATKAAQKVAEMRAGESGFALLVSCVGRKLVMGEDTEAEIDAVKDIFPAATTYAGFYSNGEICPVNATDPRPRLHNQTMTITYISE